MGPKRAAATAPGTTRQSARARRPTARALGHSLGQAQRQTQGQAQVQPRTPIQNPGRRRNAAPRARARPTATAVAAAPTGDEFDGMNRNQLNEECRQRGLPCGGSNDDKRNRIRQHDAANPTVAQTQPAQQTQQTPQSQQTQQAPSGDGLDGMNRNQLNAQCKARKLPCTGTNEDKRTRIRQYDTGNAAGAPNTAAPTTALPPAAGARQPGTFDVDGMNRNELNAECKKRGLKCVGTNADKVARIKAYDAANAPVGSTAAEEDDAGQDDAEDDGAGKDGADPEDTEADDTVPGTPIPLTTDERKNLDNMSLEELLELVRRNKFTKYIIGGETRNDLIELVQMSRGDLEKTLHEDEDDDENRDEDKNEDEDGGGGKKGTTKSSTKEDSAGGDDAGSGAGTGGNDTGGDASGGDGTGGGASGGDATGQGRAGPSSAEQGKASQVIPEQCNVGADRRGDDRTEEQVSTAADDSTAPEAVAPAQVKADGKASGKDDKKPDDTQKKLTELERDQKREDRAAQEKAEADRAEITVGPIFRIPALRMRQTNVGADGRCMWRAFAMAYWGREHAFPGVVAHVRHWYRLAALHPNTPERHSRYQLYAHMNQASSSGRQGLGRAAKGTSATSTPTNVTPIYEYGRNLAAQVLDDHVYGERDLLQVMADAFDVEIFAFSFHRDGEYELQTRGRFGRRQIFLMNYPQAVHWTALEPVNTAPVTGHIQNARESPETYLHARAPTVGLVGLSLPELQRSAPAPVNTRYRNTITVPHDFVPALDIPLTEADVAAAPPESSPPETLETLFSEAEEGDTEEDEEREESPTSRPSDSRRPKDKDEDDEDDDSGAPGAGPAGSGKAQNTGQGNGQGGNGQGGSSNRSSPPRGRRPKRSPTPAPSKAAAAQRRKRPRSDEEEEEKAGSATTSPGGYKKSRLGFPGSVSPISPPPALASASADDRSPGSSSGSSSVHFTTPDYTKPRERAVTPSVSPGTIPPSTAERAAQEFLEQNYPHGPPVARTEESPGSRKRASGSTSTDETGLSSSSASQKKGKIWSMRK